MKALTARQSEILEFITKRINEQGYPPTIREIGQAMGIRSTNGVNDHLKALERKGYLFRDGLKSRALRPVMPSSFQAPEFSEFSARGAESTVAVSVLGRVAAGAPIMADEQVLATVHVDSFFLGSHKKSEVFALRVSGDSMIDAGILDGDYIFVKKTLQARSGDIVVVMIDNEATVKRYLPKGDVILFMPENREMEPIVVRKQDFRNTWIIGQVCGVYRRM